MDSYQQWPILAGASQTNDSQSHEIPMILTKEPAQLPTKRANPGVYNTNKTSSRIRLNSLGPSPDQADPTNWAGPTPGNTFCHWELLFQGPGMCYQYAEQTAMGATTTSASKEQSHHALQDNPPRSGDTCPPSIGHKHQSHSWHPCQLLLANQHPGGCIQVLPCAICHHGVEQTTIWSSRCPVSGQLPAGDPEPGACQPRRIFDRHVFNRF